MRHHGLTIKHESVGTAFKIIFHTMISASSDIRLETLEIQGIAVILPQGQNGAMSNCSCRLLAELKPNHSEP